MSTPNSRRTGCLTIALVVGLGITVFFSSFGYYSICRTCGCWRSTVAYQLPLLPIPLCRFHRAIEQTPVSQVANAAELVPSHEHDWAFGHGNGGMFSFTCALGPGHAITSAARSERLARLIECTATYRGRKAAIKWLTLALDPERSHTIRMIPVACNFPESGFSSKAAYDAWYDRARRVYEDDFPSDKE